MLAGKGKLLAIGAAAMLIVAIAGTAGGAVIATDGDDEQPITGSALDQASEAALDHTGGGRVTGTEIGDEESIYEVEVTRDDGSQVDVQLDESFNVVGDEPDDDSGRDDEGQ